MTSPTPLPVALQTLVQELSASGSEPLLDNDGTKFTLRGAIRRILWKENFLLTLASRPVLPTQPDDQYGHVLSLRAEHLVTQAILVELAGKLGVDVVGIRAKVLGGLNVQL